MIATIIWLVAVLGGVKAALMLGRRAVRRSPDTAINDLIAQAGVRDDGMRQRWTTFDPGLREASQRRRAEADHRRWQANRISSSVLGPDEHETVPFRRTK